MAKKDDDSLNGKSAKVAKGKKVLHNGTLYTEGDTLPDLANGQKERLVKSGVIE